MSNFWDQIPGAEISKRTPWIEDGFDGDVTPRSIQVSGTQKGDQFIVEAEVATSNHPAHPVGQRVAWYQKTANRNTPGAIKEFVIAVLGGNPHDETDAAKCMPHIQQLGKLIDPRMGGSPDKNIFCGRPVHVVTRLVNKKLSAGVFTLHTWTPATGKAGAPVDATRTLAVHGMVPSQQYAPPPAAPAAGTWTPPGATPAPPNGQPPIQIAPLAPPDFSRGGQ